MKRSSPGVPQLARVCAAALLLALVPSFASAAVTSTWTVDSYEEFEEGTTESALVTSSGEVKPGWSADPIDLDFGSAWAAAWGPDGTLFLGSDNGARIYAAGGAGYRELTSIAGAVAVVSLATGADGTLYAGTMPGGQVWAVEPRTGATRLVADLEGAETVWSLSLDRSGQRIYAGTGPDGTLFEIDPQRNLARKVFATGDRRILSLLTARDGSIWLGTSGEALVFRFDPAAGTARAIADFAADEVAAMAEVEGGVVVAANQFQQPQTQGVKTAGAQDAAIGRAQAGVQPSFPEQGTGPGTEAIPDSAKTPRSGKRTGKGALFRVSADGELDQLHALTATYYTALAAGEDGAVFAGTAEEGRIYLLGQEGDVSSALDVPQRMVDQMLYHAEHGLAFTTADSGALYRVTGDGDGSIYTSTVFDSSGLSRFGALLWRGSEGLVVETRSGNTALPGPGWSSWQSPQRVTPAGPSAYRGEVASPPGRYFQYRVSFAGDPAEELQQTVLYYLPQNLPTRIQTARVQRASRSPTSLAVMKPGSAPPRSTALTLEWTVDNMDGDDTAYELAVRRVGELHWRRIDAGAAPITGTKFEWNTEGFADGYYYLRITATDRLANHRERALRDEHITRLFLVDNQGPLVSSVEVRYPEVTASASDQMSAVAEMAWSLDSGEWQVGTTRDGLFDSPAEELVIRLPDGLAPGLHTLAIRVADEAGNLGSTEITFQL